MKKSLTPLCKKLGYHFNDPSRILLALTHRSFGGQNNERLEFLGDSIVNFVIAEELFSRFQEAKEGHLSRLRARLVRGATLAEIAKEFGLGDYLRLGSGELKSGGFRRESILADALEAIIGAMYLDGGMEACRQCVLQWFESRLDQLTLEDTQKDPKTRLQEFLQSRQEALPQYDVISIEGEAHAQTFTIECNVSMLQDKTIGIGSSRRGAEQQAARKALEHLGVDKANG
ncbi:ribonuclease III [Zooshikella ganghwensis]|uniref:ribonuclease III n=1 Tax=Zooshikella ganghwensis TaxID=202772 RepID=UPI0004290305|nr:ribonuclease III [Zooshikella ganghwensis]